MGGGTPSLFSPRAIERLLQHIDNLTPLSSSTEITLEANPGTLECQRLADFRSVGINRISLGIQSFSDPMLRVLGRVHDRKQAIDSLKIAQTLFDNVNIDIMYGLPRQSIQAALDDCETAAGFQTQHFSWYQLTLEPNTYFYTHRPPLPPHDDIWVMEEQGRAILGAAGYQRYEVSAYARHRRLCNHNHNYWTFGDYLGIGAGAHSKLTDSGQRTIERLIKWKNPKDYLSSKATFIAHRELVSTQMLPFEFMLNALRLQTHIPFDLFSARTGLDKDVIALPLQQAIANGWMTVDASGFTPTPLGCRFLNDVIENFLPEPAIHSNIVPE